MHKGDGCENSCLVERSTRRMKLLQRAILKEYFLSRHEAVTGISVILQILFLVEFSLCYEWLMLGLL